MGWHMWEWGHGPGWGWMAVSHVLWWIALAAAAVALWRWWVPRGAGGPPPPAEDAALRLLRERYARGEIDQEEFEERRRHLAA
jgi:putative membrane protein